jgi:hypothetical protein
LDYSHYFVNGIKKKIKKRVQWIYIKVTLNKVSEINKADTIVIENSTTQIICPIKKINEKIGFHYRNANYVYDENMNSFIKVM